MAQAIIPKTDLEFLLFEKFKVDRLSESDRFSDYTKKTIELVVKEARSLAVKEILPTSGPVTMGRMTAIAQFGNVVMTISDEAFGGR